MNGLGRRFLVSICRLALVLLSPLVAFGDGIIIPQRAYAIPQIPDQRALIHYADGTETLVIETSFGGQGTNFAWVVPLPSAPTIAPATTGLFPTLQTIFQPEVVLSVKHYWLALPVALLAFAWLKLASRQAFSALLLLCLLLVLAGLLLPASLSKSMGMATSSAASTVRVLNRQHAGVFDTVTIQSADPASLVKWLDENGFSTPTNLAPVIADYVRGGWVFAAARLQGETGEASPRATHPLAFSFKTDKPVYPLRLTAAGVSSCRIDLYVFGPGRAHAPGFGVQRCEAPLYEARSVRPRLSAGELRIRHSELGKLVARAPVATKLTGTLDAAGMNHDAYLSWEPYIPYGQKIYSWRAATILGANVAALLFLALLIMWALLRRFRRGFKAAKYGPWLYGTAAAAGAIVCLWVPKTSAFSYRTTRLHYVVFKMNAMDLAMSIDEEMQATNGVPGLLAPPHALTAAEQSHILDVLRRDYNEAWSKHARDYHPLTNIFTGEPIRFEASPGNFVLRPSPVVEGKGSNAPAYDLVWHDLDGAEAQTNTIPARLR